MAAYAPLAHRVFSNERIEEETRLTLATPLCFQRLLFGAATWRTRHIGATKVLNAARMRVLRGIFGYRRFQASGNKADCEILAEKGLPATDIILMHRRLRLIGKALHSGPPPLVALLRQGKTDFAHQTAEDLRFLWRDSAAQWVKEWPDPAADPGPWLHMLLEPTGEALRSLIEAVPHGHTALPTRALPPKYVAMPEHDIPEGAYSEDIGWICRYCPEDARRVLQSFPALRCHEAQAHGRMRPAQRWVVGPQCPACSKCFNTRDAALQHASGAAPRCAAIIRSWEATP